MSTQLIQNSIEPCRKVTERQIDNPFEKLDMRYMQWRLSAPVNTHTHTICILNTIYLILWNRFVNVGTISPPAGVSGILSIALIDTDLYSHLSSNNLKHWRWHPLNAHRIIGEWIEHLTRVCTFPSPYSMPGIPIICVLCQSTPIHNSKSYQGQRIPSFACCPHILRIIHYQTYIYFNIRTRKGILTIDTISHWLLATLDD